MVAVRDELGERADNLALYVDGSDGDHLEKLLRLVRREAKPHEVRENEARDALAKASVEIAPR